jgi:hypothetical protein
MRVIVKEEPEIIKAPTEEEMKIINKHDPLGERYKQGYG